MFVQISWLSDGFDGCGYICVSDVLSKQVARQAINNNDGNPLIFDGPLKIYFPHTERNLSFEGVSNE